MSKNIGGKSKLSEKPLHFAGQATVNVAGVPEEHRVGAIFGAARGVERALHGDESPRVEVIKDGSGTVVKGVVRHDKDRARRSRSPSPSKSKILDMEKEEKTKDGKSPREEDIKFPLMKSDEIDFEKELNGGRARNGETKG